MGKLTVLLIVIFFIGCSDKKRPMYVLNSEQKIKVAEFIERNIKPANNMSDEEMEDVIAELKRTGIQLFGEQRMVTCTWDYNIIWGKIVKKDSTETFYH